MRTPNDSAGLLRCDFKETLIWRRLDNLTLKGMITLGVQRPCLGDVFLYQRKNLKCPICIPANEGSADS